MLFDGILDKLPVI